jgi:hypothetical protein
MTSADRSSVFLQQGGRKALTAVSSPLYNMMSFLNFRNLWKSKVLEEYK